jgi:hypothetical protein
METLEGCGKKYILRHFPSIHLKGLRTTITGQRFELESSNV